MRRSGTLGCSLNVGPGPAARREQIQQFTLETCTSVAVELRRLFSGSGKPPRSLHPSKMRNRATLLDPCISLRSRLFLPLTEENGAVVRPGATAPFTNSGASSPVPERSNLPRIAARTAHECYFSPARCSTRCNASSRMRRRSNSFGSQNARCRTCASSTIALK
jgi:hypothetical protein